MNDRHETKPVDQLGIIRGLLEHQSIKTDALEAKIDAHRAEGARLEVTVSTMHNEMRRLTQRMTEAEDDIRELRDQNMSVRRYQTSSNEEHAAAITGAIAHVRALEASLSSLRESDERKTRIDKAICREFGLDYELISTTDEPTNSSSKRKTTLAAIARENKLGVAATTALLVLNIVLEVLRRLH